MRESLNGRWREAERAEAIVARRGRAVPRLAGVARRRAGDRVAPRARREHPVGRARRRRRPARRALRERAAHGRVADDADREQAAARPDRAAQGGGRDRGLRVRRRGRGISSVCGRTRMLLRVGSRGSRLALTQAELAGEPVRGPGIEIALVPITTAGDRDRTKPFGEIGERGVFVKELEEALLDGRIDVAVHSAKDMTSTDTDGLVVGAYLAREDPRDALCGADADPARDADRHRLGAPACAAARARAVALDRASAREHRHQASQARRARARRGGARRVRPRPARARRARSATASSPDEMLPEAGQGALALQVRVGDEELVAAANDAETRARVEPERALRGGDRRRMPRADRGASRRGDADGARCRPGRPLGRAPHAETTRHALAVGAAVAASRRVKVIVTRPRAQAGPLVDASRAARPRGRRVPADRDRAAADEPVDVEGYDWVIVDEPERRRASSSGVRGRRCRRSQRSARGRPRRCASSGSSPLSSRRLHPGRPPCRVPAAGGPRALCGRRGRAPRARRRARRRLRRALRTTSCDRRSRRRATRRGRVGVGRARRSRRSASTSRSSRSGPQTTRVAEALGLRVVAEADTHDLDGLVAAVGSLASR